MTTSPTHTEDTGELLYRRFGLTQEVADEIGHACATFVTTDNVPGFLKYMLFLTKGEQALAVCVASMMVLRQAGEPLEAARIIAAQLTAQFLKGQGCPLLSIPPDPDKAPVPDLATVQRLATPLDN